MTIAKTGRRMQRSGSFIRAAYLPGAGWAALAAPGSFGGTGATGAPSRSLICPAVTTMSPAARPLVICTSPGRRTPVSTAVMAALPSTIRNTKRCWPTGTMASSGIRIAPSMRAVTSEMRLNRPGRNSPEALSTLARIAMERPLASISGSIA